jgi:hypothetical protein
MTRRKVNVRILTGAVPVALPTLWQQEEHWACPWENFWPISGRG